MQFCTEQTYTVSGGWDTNRGC